MGDRLGIPGAVSFYTAASLQETWACNYVDARARAQAHVNVLLVPALLWFSQKKENGAPFLVALQCQVNARSEESKPQFSPPNAQKCI